jgi:hypothetical protein
MQVAFSRFSQLKADISGLVQTQKIGLPTPFLDFPADRRRQLLPLQSFFHLLQKLFLLGEIMNLPNKLGVPILRWFASRPSNGKNGEADPLPPELFHFPVAKCLRKRRKPFKQVADLDHAED